MHLLYEENGELKAGTVLERSPASFHVESPHGRRSKVKAASVLLSFERPTPAELLGEAESFSQGLETHFLWECSGAREFGFEELAREYVGREPTPAEAAGVLMKLHSAPMYFYRRGRGRFQAAPEATLKLALAAVEKKKRVQEQVTAWAEKLAGGECPAEVAELKDELLYAPDRNKPQTRALEQACAKTGLSPARLFERCGLLPDSHDYHLKRFLHEFFPRGTAFPPHEVPRPGEDLPRAALEAFSLDDVGTTEIDDAFSVQPVAGGWRLGIHIAAPALGFAPGSALDAIARERLSTAYMPGRKFTMLPQDVIEAFSLDHGGELPAVSLYVELDENYAVRGRHTRLERVPIVANLRHVEYDRLNEAFEGKESRGLAFEEELKTLWRAAAALEARRGRPSAGAAALDYNFHVENERVRIVPRKRGAPLDKLVAEMMILVNTAWGEFLAERDVAAIYRVQSTGKVRFGVHPEPHEGLGVACYAWMSSPLRRYVDLVNQWQLAAALCGRKAPFARNSDTLLAALRAFEVTAARYDEHQRAMETYWSLRWILQEKLGRLEAVVLRENLVRVQGLPLLARVTAAPTLDPGTLVRMEVAGVDLLERTLACAYRETLGRVEDATGESGQKA
ncbi:MAG TPA: RNB domain-containing ribonuclease [Burkholderiales bacterium]|nr:RNB domain-containing ribonuclease [Burkholderiales bacterium]